MQGYKVSFKEACKLLQQGDVVSIPTETVYGLAGDISNAETIKKIFHIKQRPFFDPLIVHFSHWSQLKKIAQCSSPVTERLSQSFHPGPLTLVLPKKEEISDLVTSHLPTVAVRIPSHSLTLKLLRETQLLLAAPSANLFSKISPTRAEHVTLSLSVPVLDGGPCDVGIESTILEVQEDQKTLVVLRPGVIGLKELHKFLKSNNFTNWSVHLSDSNLSTHPGQFHAHYTPDAPLVLVQVQKRITSDAIIKKIKEFYPLLEPEEYKISDDPYLLARNLYHNLRNLSQNSVGYVVRTYPFKYKNDAWRAVWNRLEKASSKTINL